MEEIALTDEDILIAQKLQEMMKSDAWGAIDYQAKKFIAESVEALVVKNDDVTRGMIQGVRRLMEWPGKFIEKVSAARLEAEERRKEENGSLEK